MNSAPRRRCTTPGCPTITLGGRCDTCRRGKKRLTRTRARAVDNYGPRWPGFRLDYLIRHPRCVLCRRLSNVPDHWPVSRRDLVAAGERNPDQDCYVRALCTSCHNRQTAANQPGGWHRDRR